MLCSYHNPILGHFYYHKKLPLEKLQLIPTLIPTPGNNWCAFCLYSFAFSSNVIYVESYISYIWILSPRITVLDLLCLVVSSYCWIALHYMGIPYFHIHSPTEGHLVWIIIMNNAPVNIHVQVFVWK